VVEPVVGTLILPVRTPLGLRNVAVLVRVRISIGSTYLERNIGFKGGYLLGLKR